MNNVVEWWKTLMRLEKFPMFTASEISPSDGKRYRVAFAHRHKSLKTGDVVIMTETPKFENLLFRESDMTLHELTDEFDQYVHLEIIP